MSSVGTNGLDAESHKQEVGKVLRDGLAGCWFGSAHEIY